VLAKFAARNFKPEAYTLYSYASVEVIAQAAAAIKSLEPLKVAAELHSGKSYKTAIGDLSFDSKGDVTRIDYVMYTWKAQPDGSIAYVQN
jgi:branched-chain amino acid transport system substrate-binding protein